MREAAQVGFFRVLCDRDPPLDAIHVSVRRRDLIHHWPRCGMTADYVGLFLSARAVKPLRDSASLSTVANELLENAVKYALSDDDGISLRAYHLGDQMGIETHHLCRRVQAESLRARIEGMHHQNAEALFLEQMQHTATVEPTSSGLGLLSLTRDFHAALGLQVAPGPVHDAVQVTLQAWVSNASLTVQG